MGEVTGEQLVRWTERDFPGRTPGTRAAHTVGIGVQGWFEPSEVAARYCSSPIFGPPPNPGGGPGRVPVVARFSNGSGLAEERDLHTDARGLAVKFWPGSPDESDLVAMTLALFFVSTAEAFEGFSAASVPVPVDQLRLGWWKRLQLMLRLQVAPASPPADVTAAIDPSRLSAYALRHPEAKSAVAALAGLINPVSYGRACYHGVHAFRMCAPDGTERFVRYQWEPLLGVRGVSLEQMHTLPDDHLHTDLRHRLARGSVRFALSILVADEGDDVADPTTPWPVQRRRITGGILTLDRLVADQETDQVDRSYNPTRTAAGFVPVAADDLVWARGRAYQYSCGQRHGTGCPV